MINTRTKEISKALNLKGSTWREYSSSATYRLDRWTTISHNLKLEGLRKLTYKNVLVNDGRVIISYLPNKFKAALEGFSEAVRRAQKTKPSKELVSQLESIEEALSVGEMSWRKNGLGWFGRKRKDIEIIFEFMPVSSDSLEPGRARINYRFVNDMMEWENIQISKTTFKEMIKQLKKEYNESNCFS